jgi:hypothetical protein
MNFLSKISLKDLITINRKLFRINTFILLPIWSVLFLVNHEDKQKEESNLQNKNNDFKEYRKDSLQLWADCVYWNGRLLKKSDTLKKLDSEIWRLYMIPIQSKNITKDSLKRITSTINRLKQRKEYKLSQLYNDTRAQDSMNLVLRIELNRMYDSIKKDTDSIIDMSRQYRKLLIDCENSH